MSADPNLPQWIQDHIRLYLESGGEEGHIWNGVPTLLLETIGRKSGETRLLPLIYGKTGEDYVVVASKGGAPEHPAWYLNLVDEPQVEVQVGPEKFRARARTATADERPELWKKMVAIWPDYEEYRTKTDREIPIVVLEREAGDAS